jgi:hypothetical protein
MTLSRKIEHAMAIIEKSPKKEQYYTFVSSVGVCFFILNICFALKHTNYLDVCVQGMLR